MKMLVLIIIIKMTSLIIQRVTEYSDRGDICSSCYETKAVAFGELIKITYLNVEMGSHFFCNQYKGVQIDPAKCIPFTKNKWNVSGGCYVCDTNVTINDYAIPIYYKGGSRLLISIYVCTSCHQKCDIPIDNT